MPANRLFQRAFTQTCLRACRELLLTSSARLARLSSVLIVSLLIVQGSLANTSQSEVKGSLVIIIDDIGNHLQLGQRAMNLPGKLNYAVLPHTPQGSTLAKYAAMTAPEKEVLLHMPMEAMGEQILGPAGLYARLDRKEFSDRIERALAEIPNAVGLSNHMGSLLTQEKEKMGWVMAELNERELYFLDSRTASATSARQAAMDHKVPYVSRDFFLDHQRNAEAMQTMMERAIANAKRHGVAVVIGHPYRSTLSFLEEQLPLLEGQGIELITVSEAIAHRSSGRLAALN